MIHFTVLGAPQAAKWLAAQVLALAQERWEEHDGDFCVEPGARLDTKMAHFWRYCLVHQSPTRATYCNIKFLLQVRLLIFFWLMDFTSFFTVVGFYVDSTLGFAFCHFNMFQSLPTTCAPACFAVLSRLCFLSLQSLQTLALFLSLAFARAR